MDDGWLERLAARGTPAETPHDGPHAAVAVVLRAGEAGPEALLMQRVARPGDRWSGQVSLPGGRAEPEDPDLRATAVRETHEEVGVDLDAGARLVARLDRFQALARGKHVDLWITPFVFEATAPLEPTTGPEASAVFWLPLREAASCALDDHYRYAKGGLVLSLPSWRYDGRVVWGMTWRVLTGLLDDGSGSG